jgi:hypothetical protein
MTIWQKCYWAKDPERHDVSAQERITSRSQYHHHDAIVMKGLEVFRDAESRRTKTTLLDISWVERGVKFVG